MLSVMSCLFGLAFGIGTGGNPLFRGGIRTASNLLPEHDLFRGPHPAFGDHALTRANRPEKQRIRPAAQLHWQLYRLYSGQISRGRLVAVFHLPGVS
ncbi:MAG: hypothetical protein E5W60_25395 [Mesorhizobium sp.]|nr:MAG: hypothetical protein E5W60_25395 [Mesorhizobium sp.]